MADQIDQITARRLCTPTFVAGGGPSRETVERSLPPPPKLPRAVLCVQPCAVPPPPRAEQSCIRYRSTPNLPPLRRPGSKPAAGHLPFCSTAPEGGQWQVGLAANQWAHLLPLVNKMCNSGNFLQRNRKCFSPLRQKVYIPGEPLNGFTMQLALFFFASMFIYLCFFSLGFFEGSRCVPPPLPEEGAPHRQPSVPPQHMAKRLRDGPPGLLHFEGNTVTLLKACPPLRWLAGGWGLGEESAKHRAACLPTPPPPGLCWNRGGPNPPPPDLEAQPCSPSSEGWGPQAPPENQTGTRCAACPDVSNGGVWMPPPKAISMVKGLRASKPPNSP